MSKNIHSFTPTISGTDFPQCVKEYILLAGLNAVVESETIQFFKDCGVTLNHEQIQEVYSFYEKHRLPRPKLTLAPEEYIGCIKSIAPSLVDITIDTDE